MAQLIKVFTAKLNKLSSIPWTRKWWKGKADTLQLSGTEAGRLQKFKAILSYLVRVYLKQRA